MIKTRLLTFTALMISLSIIISFFFDSTIFLFGIPALKISISSPMLQSVSILGGSLYGGLAYVIKDVIAFIIKPVGVFWWETTVIMFLKGFFIGVIYNVIKEINYRKFNIIFIIFTTISFFISFILFVQIITNTYFVLAEIKGTFIYNLTIFTFLFLAITWTCSILITKYSEIKVFSIYFLSIFFPSIIATGLNTFVILKRTVNNASFLPFLIPRLIKEIFTCYYSAFVLIIIITIVNRYFYNEVKNEKN